MAPSDIIGTAKVARGAADAAFVDERADGAAADGLAAKFDDGRDQNFEAALGAEGAERIDVAGLFGAEAEVVADEDGAGVEAAAEDLADELGWREPCNFGGEGEHERLLGAGGGHEVKAAIEGGEKFGGALGRNDMGGVRIESEHRSLPAAGVGEGADAADDFAVPDMHAIGSCRW